MNANHSLSRCAPEAEGIASSGVLAFLAAAEAQSGGLHDFMLLRHGQVVAEGAWEPYGSQRPHMLFSLSKSFTSTGIGLAVAEGRLSVDDPVLSFFPNDAPAQVSPHLAAMCVRHLLTMSTGHSTDALTHRDDGNWVRSALAQPVEHEPGTFFLYNNGASFLLSAIVQQVTGQPLRDYLEPRLFMPLGIAGATWDTNPQGISLGMSGLSVKIEDIARFGQLYLQKGRWDGQSILPENWVQSATSAQVSNASQSTPDWQQGYGYQFWRSRHGYRGDGAFGQFCVVLPVQETVVAITSGVRDMQALLNLVWQHLLPALGPAPRPQSADADALAQKLARLSLPGPVGSPSSPLATRVSGRKYLFPTNDQKVDSITLELDGSGWRLTLTDDRGKHQIEGALDGWRPGTTTLDRRGPLKVAAWGAWTREDTFEMRGCYTETPFRPTLTLQFADDRVFFDHRVNVAFGPTEWPQLIGQAGG